MILRLIKYRFERNNFLLALVFLAPGITNAQDEVTTIDGVVTALYQSISGASSEPRDWQRFQNLFAPYAQINSLVPMDQGVVEFRQGSVSEYIENSTPFFEARDFYEYEIGRKTDEYYGLAQVFSSYEYRFEKEGEVMRRGINSMQLAFFEGRWWIISLTYNAESPHIPIPDIYLSK
jgi:hypothetical protein